MHMHIWDEKAFLRERQGGIQLGLFFYVREGFLFMEFCIFDSLRLDILKPK
jgi:hypothetical protein